MRFDQRLKKIKEKKKNFDKGKIVRPVKVLFKFDFSYILEQNKYVRFIERAHKIFGVNKHEP